MLIGYTRISKSDGSQSLALQCDSLKKARFAKKHVYHDMVSGKKGDRLVRFLQHLVNTVHDLDKCGVGLKVLTGQGANIDTTTASWKMVFGIFASLAEFEREIIRERTKAGLASARARGRVGGKKHALSKAQVRMAQAAMGKPETHIGELCGELKINRSTLYRYVGPDGKLREHGKQVLAISSITTVSVG